MTEEEIGVSCKRDDTQACFGGVVVIGNSSVGETEFESGALMNTLGERFAQRTFGKHAGSFGIDPREELVNGWLGDLLPHGEMCRGANDAGGCRLVSPSLTDQF